MSDITETRVLYKLFGGRMHGRAHAQPWQQPTVEIISIPKGKRSPMFMDYGTYGQGAYSGLASTVTYQSDIYIRRRAILGKTELIYWAITSASSERAFEMLTNYLLRGTEKVS